VPKTIIQIEGLYKEYQLGVVGHGTLYRDLQSWWAKIRGREDPNSVIGMNQQKRDVGAGRVLALENIGFEVREGEVLGVIGANGAGKSTLLKILSRITAPTKGTIKIRGRVGSLLEVGTGFHSELTGRENIYLNGAIHGMSQAETAKKLDQIVDFASVETFLDTPVKRYSSGMYVRLAFAVAAHLDPDVLVVDEVLAVGDADFQKKAIGKMQDVSRNDGRTVLFVSHNMESVRKLCSRAVMLEKGGVTRDGAVDEVIGYYLGLAGTEGEHRAGEQVWGDLNKAPGSDIVRLTAIRTMRDNGELSSSFDVREAIVVEIEYIVLKEGYQLASALEFANPVQVIFVAADSYTKGVWGEQDPVPVGTCKTKFFIPGDFLAEGKILINVNISTPPFPGNQSLQVREKAISEFYVTDAMDPKGVRGSYPYSWGQPALRPRIESVTEISPS
jgi:lipopolysaccharide transport system ATP-binding protein